MPENTRLNIRLETTSTQHKHKSKTNNMSEILKAKQEALSRKLRRSITSVQEVLDLAKRRGLKISKACVESGKSRNYVNCALFFLRAAEKKNKIRIPELQRLEKELAGLKALRNGVVTAVKASDERIGMSQIENAIAGMKHAVSNRVSMAEAGAAIGKSASYLPVCVSTLGSIQGTRSQKEEVSELHSEYLKLVQAGQIKTSRKASRRVKRNNRFKTSGKRKNARKRASRKLNPLSHIVGSDVEFKYPVITDRPVSKVVETYPLEVMKPGHAFAVPARKSEMRNAIKAVRKYARRNPRVKFLQLKEGKEFVTWRTK